MNCPRCKNVIAEGASKCDNCGLIIINSNNQNVTPNENVAVSNPNIAPTESVTINNQNNIPAEQVVTQDNNEQNDVNSNNVVNLEGYFVGKNYDKLKKRKWSFNTLLFGFAYTLYRKLILLSLIWIAIDVASVLIMGKYSIFVIVGLNVVMSFLFHYIYFALGNNKIDNVKRKYWGHSIDEIIYRTSKKGGTSGLAIFFLGFSVVVACIVGILLYVVYYPQYYVDKLYYRVPSDFESYSSDTDGRMSYVYSDNVNYCSIVVSKESEYSSASEYIDKRTANEENVEKEKVSIFGKDWDVITINRSDNSKVYYHVIEKGGVVYNYEFNIYNGFGQKCEKYYNYVKYSMTVR